MDIQAIIAQMKNSGHDPVRSRRVYSWGDRNTCQRLFIEIFQSVDKTATNFEFLPEYNAIIDWMTNTRGMGLLLTGDCGRGKSTILTGVVPVLPSNRACRPACSLGTIRATLRRIMAERRKRAKEYRLPL